MFDKIKTQQLNHKITPHSSWAIRLLRAENFLPLCPSFSVMERFSKPLRKKVWRNDTHDFTKMFHKKTFKSSILEEAESFCNELKY